MIYMLYFLLLELLFPIPTSDSSTQQNPNMQQSHVIEDIEFCEQIERAYRIDVCALNRIAGKYKTSAFNDVLQNLQNRRLKDLLVITQAEINQTYDGSVNDLFIQTCKQTEPHVSLEQRTALWIHFIEHCYKCQKHMRQQKLPDVWFAKQEHHANDELFVHNNQKLKINASTQRYLIADSVLAYIPFALVQRRDPQALHAIMHMK